MPATARGQEASSLLPLRPLGETNHVNDFDNDLDLLDEEDYAHGFDALNHKSSSRLPKIWRLLLSWIPFHAFSRRRLKHSGQPASSASAPTKPWKRRLLVWFGISFLTWTAFIVILLPSYTRPPRHYLDLQKRALASDEPGRANINNEKVFIAASIYDKDGSLISGAWGNAVADLVHLLGPENVFLSIYENDASEEAAQALRSFRDRVTCESTLVNEHLDISDLQRVTMPDGKRLLKRIAFLAKVRNQALAPLDEGISTKFDKLLYINDVVFNPIDAANLLFSTNQGADGKAGYRAACAVDFINPVKFYDTFATRDLEGYDMGVPFYPWFTTAGQGASREDVKHQKDAVRVRSCWGGMVAFRASYFQSTPAEILPRAPRQQKFPRDSAKLVGRAPEMTPIRFRAEEDPFWDASECCLIHADLQQINAVDLKSSTEIYMNPYIRVAYDSRTLSWLGFTRRFERMYSPVQSIVNYIGSRPSKNPRRLEEPGQTVSDRVWVTNRNSNSGSYQDVQRVAKPGGFCGMRKLLALPTDGHGAHWYAQSPPPDV